MNIYNNQRLKSLGVTPDTNSINVTNPSADTGSKYIPNQEIFSLSKEGNINILYTTIDRHLIQYEITGNGKMSQHNSKLKTFQQIRLKEPIGDMKYKIPKGAGTHPFFPPLLQDHFEKEQKIETLVLTEGAFKAWKAALLGIPCVGLSSITHYRDSETKRLHHGIIKLIETCKVDNVIVLWDADCLNVSEKDLYGMQELTKRPKTFYNSAVSIRNLLGEVNDLRKAKAVLEDDVDAIVPPLKIYFAHIKKQIPGMQPSPKGLDDLLIESKGKDCSKQIIEAATNLNAKTCPFFQKLNITHESQSLRSYFKLDDVQKFYLYHADTIRNEHFLFDNSIYEWTDSDGGQLKMKAPGWSKKIIWVANDFYIKKEVPTAYDEIEEQLVRHTVEDLKRRTRKKNFWEYLEDNCYMGFVNIPSHYNYQQTIGDSEKYYNKYFPFKHRPKTGDCKVTLDFIKHIFGHEKKIRNGKEYESWELGLDYIQLLLEKPTQTLPVLILFSEENATGKSTFGNWLRFIFGSNAIKVSNKDFKADFNEHFSSKLLVICEETLLDRRKDSESIKDMATSKHITVNAKGTQQYQIDFFAKFIFMSNNKRMIYLTKHDQRYWILKVPKIKKDDPLIQDKLREEFPAFLHFMQQRSMVSQNESRMWFHHSLIKTEQFYNTVQVNEPADVRELRASLKEYFLTFGVKEIRMPIKEINNQFFNGRVKKTWLEEILVDYNVGYQSRNEQGKTKVERGNFFVHEKEYNEKEKVWTTTQRTVKWHGRGPYIFLRENFVEEKEESLVEESTVANIDLFELAKNQVSPKKAYPPSWDSSKF